jgi:hypothetical protein
MLKQSDKKQKERMRSMKEQVAQLQQDHDALTAENERLSGAGLQGELPEMHSERHEKELRKKQRQLERAVAQKSQLEDKLQMLTDEGTMDQQSRIVQLEKRVQVLQAQNAALRSEPGGIGIGIGVAEDTTGRTLGGGGDRDRDRGRGRGGGRTSNLDGMDGPEPSPGRERSHAAWEREKQLARRVEVLKARLEEKAKELEVANAQSGQAQGQLQRAQRENTMLQKKTKKLGGTGTKFSHTLSPSLSFSLTLSLFLTLFHTLILSLALPLTLSPSQIHTLKHFPTPTPPPLQARTNLETCRACSN